MLKEFRDFLMRGNLVTLAVAFVMGVAFAAVVTSFVNDLVMPIIAMIFGKQDFSALTFTVNDAVFRYGSFLTALITFVAIAAAVFFFVVRPINALTARRRTQPDPDSETHACSECLSEIPVLARRCAFCGSPQTPVAATT